LTILTFLSFSVLFFSLIMGITILFIDYKPSENRIFFFLCLSLAVWALGPIFVFSSTNQEIFKFWLNIGLIGSLSFFGLTLHFSLAMTKLIKLKFYHLAIIYFFPLSLLVLNNIFNIQILYEKIIYQSGHYLFIMTPHKILFYLYGIIANICVGSAFLILFIWRRKTKINKQKKQALILSVTLLISLILGMTAEYYIPIILKNNYSNGTSLFYVLIWISGIWYSIVKYKFLSITPELVGNEVISKIDELIIIMDNTFKIIKINHKAEEILNYNNEELFHNSIKKILSNQEKITDEINKMISENINSFSCRINLLTNENTIKIIDVKISIVKDKFNDILGFLIIGKEIKGIKQLKSYYKITDREAEVIELLIYGYTNLKIAEALKISERTVKAHVSHVFDKFGVDNKVQLINFLKDYHLIPEKDAEKTIIF